MWSGPSPGTPTPHPPTSSWPKCAGAPPGSKLVLIAPWFLGLFRMVRTKCTQGLFKIQMYPFIQIVTEVLLHALYRKLVGAELWATKTSSLPPSPYSLLFSAIWLYYSAPCIPINKIIENDKTSYEWSRVLGMLIATGVSQLLSPLNSQS